FDTEKSRVDTVLNLARHGVYSGPSSWSVCLKVGCYWNSPGGVKPIRPTRRKFFYSLLFFPESPPHPRRGRWMSTVPFAFHHLPLAALAQVGGRCYQAGTVDNR
ncbi:unnamed protein product, partial [Ectocarpus sp. 12 AP-2014]